MSENSSVTKGFRYPTTLDYKEPAESERKDVELYYMGDEINPYSLRELDIDEVRGVIAVDSYEDIANEVKEIARNENVLAIFEENTERLEDAVNKVTEPSEDEISYIITNEAEGEYVLEDYSDGSLIEKNVINNYDTARQLAQAKVLGTSLDTLNILNKAKSDLEEFEEKYQDYISSGEGLVALPDKKTEELKNSLKEFEDSLEESKNHLEPEASPVLHDEISALNARREMIKFEIEEILDDKNTEITYIGEKNFI
jgi:hypothetical protein